MNLNQLLDKQTVRRYLERKLASIKWELLTRSLRSTDQGRQNQKHHGQTHNGQGEIEKYQIIWIDTHDRFLSNDGLGLSIRNGTTTEATATWAKSAAIAANLSSWVLVNNGALSTISSKNFPINSVYHQLCN